MGSAVKSRLAITFINQQGLQVGGLALIVHVGRADAHCTLVRRSAPLKASRRLS